MFLARPRQADPRPISSGARFCSPTVKVSPTSSSDSSVCEYANKPTPRTSIGQSHSIIYGLLARALDHRPAVPSRRAAGFGQFRQSADEQRELDRFLKAKPDATLNSVSKNLGYAHKELGDHLLAGLRKAGLPE